MLRSRDSFANLSQINAELGRLFKEFTATRGLEIGIETYRNNSVTANVSILFALWHNDLI